MKSQAYLAALLAIVTWAGAPVANKLAVGGMGPLELTLIRCLLSGASGLVLALVLRIKRRGAIRWVYWRCRVLEVFPRHRWSIATGCRAHRGCMPR